MSSWGTTLTAWSGSGRTVRNPPEALVDGAGPGDLVVEIRENT